MEVRTRARLAGLRQLVLPAVEVLPDQNFFRPLFGSLGTGLVDVLCPLPGGCHQTGLAIEYGEHPAHTGGPMALSLGIDDMGLTHAQRGAVIAVLGQDGQVAVNGAADHPLGLSIKDTAVRCDHR